jgi:hypothetical protein
LRNGIAASSFIDRYWVASNVTPPGQCNVRPIGLDSGPTGLKLEA